MTRHTGERRRRAGRGRAARRSGRQEPRRRRGVRQREADQAAATQALPSSDHHAAAAAEVRRASPRGRRRRHRPRQGRACDGSGRADERGRGSAAALSVRGEHGPADPSGGGRIVGRGAWDLLTSGQRGMHRRLRRTLVAPSDLGHGQRVFTTVQPVTRHSGCRAATGGSGLWPMGEDPGRHRLVDRQDPARVGLVPGDGRHAGEAPGLLRDAVPAGRGRRDLLLTAGRTDRRPVGAAHAGPISCSTSRHSAC